MLRRMGSIGQFFIFIAFFGPAVLAVWYIFSTLGRITRGIEIIAATLLRMEQNGSKLTR